MINNPLIKRFLSKIFIEHVENIRFIIKNDRLVLYLFCIMLLIFLSQL